MNQTLIRYAEPALIPSFHQALDSVAREKIYLDMIEAPPLEIVTNFQLGLIQKGGAVFYAVANERGHEKVVGWCDIFPESNPRHEHRGSVGMGIIPAYRGQGIGQRLLEACLEKAAESGLEKAELNVYTNNLNAIALYERCGFEREGVIRHYRKLEGQYFDCVMMGKFLGAK